MTQSDTKKTHGDKGYKRRVTVGIGRKAAPGSREAAQYGLSLRSYLCSPLDTMNSYILRYTLSFSLKLEAKHVQSKFGLCSRNGSQIRDTD